MWVMVQWFCQWRLFDLWTSYFGIMSQYDTTFDLKVNVGHCDLYFMVQWFLPYILNTIWYVNIIPRINESVWPNVWPKNKCMSLWPIFHGPIILSCILKAVWCMNIILRDYESVWLNIWPQNICRSLWGIFHGPLNLPYILKTIWASLWDHGTFQPS